MRLKEVVCPFCLEPIEREHANRRAVYCNRIQLRDPKRGEPPLAPNVERVQFRHSFPKPLEATDEWDVEWYERITSSYLTAAKEGRVRFVSLAGPPMVGKTVWLLAAGAHTQCPGPMSNHLDLEGSMKGRIPTVRQANKDALKGAIQQLPLGKLPLRTSLERYDALTLPLLISCQQGNIGALGQTDGHQAIASNKDSLCLVIKDVAGEAFDYFDPFVLMRRRDRQHLFLSDWIVLALNGSDEHALAHSAGRMEMFLNNYERYSREQIEETRPQVDNLPPSRWWKLWQWKVWRHLRPAATRPPRAPGIVVMLTQVDGRSEIPDDPLWKSVMTTPHSFCNGPVDLSKYVAQMQEVDRCTEQVIGHAAKGFLRELYARFDRKRIHFVAASPLGGRPHRVTTAVVHDTYEAQCVGEPSFVRVMDPILWILEAEGRLHQR